MKNWIWISLICFCGFPLLAQIDAEVLEKLEVRNVGPAGMSGRVTAIDVDLSNKNRIFIGSASGGVWKTENAGTTWTPLFDEQDNLSIGALKINQSNPDEIWVGTGEGNPRNSHNSGNGVYKSIDGGKTWMHLGLEDSRLIHRIIINKDNPKEVYLGVMGSAWGDSKTRGVYKTTDGGKSWNNVLYVNERTGVSEMVVDPSNPNKILVAMWDFRRHPWYFTSGGPGSGLHLTYDGGETWTKLGEEEGLPKGDLGRMGLAYSASNPERVYALIESKKTGLYKSDDGGANWSLVSTENIGNRPFYYAEIYVDPNNQNKIYNLWSYVSLSEDGGKTFKTIMDYGNAVHPDHHAFWIDPDDSNYLIDGNDGGLNISRDGKNWDFVDNLPIGQFYHVNIDEDFPYNIYGGMQDNGTWVGPAFVLKRGGIRNGDWQELYFGDGFDVAPHPANSRFGYAMSQGGSVGFWDRETGHVEFIKPNTADSIQYRFNWNSPLAIDPFHEDGVYFGSQYVHHSLNKGKSWKVLSPDLTTNDTLKQKQITTGGLTVDDTEAENHTTLLCIAPSPHDNKTIFTGSDDGELYRTKDGGENWTRLTNKLIGCPKNAWIPQIEISSINPDEIFVVVNNYRMNDWKPYLYHSSNGGDTWSRIVKDNDVKGFVCSVLQDPKEENLLYLGTDAGLYFSIDKGRSWIDWPKSLPNVQIRDMKINEKMDDLVLGTFGRSFWVLDDLIPLREMVKQGKNFGKQKLQAFDTEDAYMSEYRSYDGIRFVAQGDFIGENKKRGAQILVWYKDQKEKAGKDQMDKKDKKSQKDKEPNLADEAKAKKKGKKDKKDKAQFTIIDSVGDTIRTFTRKIEDGINEIRWNMTMDGVDYPRRKLRDKKDDKPSGAKVKPGTYQCFIDYNDLKDSTILNIKPDPRLDYDEELAKRKYGILKEYYALVETSTAGMEKIQNAKKYVKLSKKIISDEQDSTYKEVKMQADSVLTALNSLELQYMREEGAKGYQRTNDKLNTMLYQSSYYINSTFDGGSDNALVGIDKISLKLNAVMDEINTFLSEKYKPYKVAFESLDIEVLKDIDELNKK